MSTERSTVLTLAPGTATGIGSMPGEDAREAAKTVTGSLEGWPFLPELPARGPGADMTGRTLGMLVELYARVEPSGWRFGDRPGRDTRRSHAWLREDLDALEEFTQDFQGPLKIQAVGPWTLASTVEMRGGEAALSDSGARRDLAGSLAEGLRLHVEDVSRRVPGARVVLQLDEPGLAAVLLGRVPSASGYRTHPAVDRAVAESTLRELVEAVGVPVVVHTCAPGVPFGLLRRAGAAGISFDFSLITQGDWDAVGEAVEAGTVLLAGVVPGTDTGGAAGGPRMSDPAGSVNGVRSLWRGLGLAPQTLGESVVVTPACGLAGASPAYARAALARCVTAARTLVDDPE
ncbi:methionine synthase [Streptomyces sp. SL13]|uniref:Methionine synthase n=2 Tax=Streptantibioticus silvisoli TaxID=2705255 RepID=A0AA90H409_9ACTN|nr:methionine synthase [Streptantibioticus silvisoli]MDI5968405.1 methionine synthase [Streptantibioticus silvisoli]